jgi:hypothetical protein
MFSPAVETGGGGWILERGGSAVELEGGRSSRCWWRSGGLPMAGKGSLRAARQGNPCGVVCLLRERVDVVLKDDQRGMVSRNSSGRVETTRKNSRRLGFLGCRRSRAVIAYKGSGGGALVCGPHLGASFRQRRAGLLSPGHRWRDVGDDRWPPPIGGCGRGKGEACPKEQLGP